MKLKRLLAVLLALVLLNGAISAYAQTEFVLELPSELKIIGEEAFYGCLFIDRVEVPEGTIRIHAKAFANSSLREISLPGTIEAIADDAFEGCADFWIEAETGSFVYNWAVGKGYSVIGTGSGPTVTPTPPGDEDELPWIPAYAWS